MGKNYDLREIDWPMTETTMLAISDTIQELKEIVKEYNVGLSIDTGIPKGFEATIEPTLHKAAIYELGRVDPVAFATRTIAPHVDIKKEYTGHSGSDVRVLINEEVLGCAQAFSLHVEGDKELITIVGLVFEADGYVLGIPKRLNGRTIRIEAANEYGSRVEFVNNRLLKVDSFHVGAAVDDMAIEWQLHGELLPLEE